jgi:hypothetical protein
MARCSRMRVLSWHMRSGERLAINGSLCVRLILWCVSSGEHPEILVEYTL